MKNQNAHITDWAQRCQHTVSVRQVVAAAHGSQVHGPTVAKPFRIALGMPPFHYCYIHVWNLDPSNYRTCRFACAAPNPSCLIATPAPPQYMHEPRLTRARLPNCSTAAA